MVNYIKQYTLTTQQRCMSDCYDLLNNEVVRYTVYLWIYVVSVW